MGLNHRQYAYLFLMFWFSTGLAQSPVVLDPVEVVAPPLSGDQTQITAESLKKKGNPPFVFDALPGEPGVTALQQGGVGAPSSVSLRGLGGNRTLVTLQNIPINTAASDGNQSYYYLFPTQFLRHMTVERGALGASEGPNAMGGRVALTPKKGPDQDGTQTEVVGEGGSFGTLKTGLGQGYTQGSSSFYGGMSHFQTDGFSRKDPREFGQRNRFTQDSVLVNGMVKPTDILEVSAFAYGAHHRLHGDAFPLSDLRTVTNFQDALVGAQTQLTPRDGTTSHHLQVAHHDLCTRATEGHLRQKAQADHGRYHLLWIPNTTHRVIAGGQLDRDYLHNPQSVTKSVTNQATFLRHQGVWGRVHTHLGSRLYHHGQFGTQGLYEGGVAVRGPWKTDVFSNLGTGFRPPTLTDLYGRSTFGIPNPNLKPERNRMADVGVQTRQGPLTARLTTFQNHTRNLIESEFTQGKFRPINRGKTKTQGIEMALQICLHEAWEVALTHTQLRTQDLRTHKPLIRQPQHQSHMALYHRPVKDLLLSLDTFGVGKSYDRSDGNRISLNAYKLVNLSATYTLTPGRMVFVRFTNIFNRHYQVISGFATAPRAIQGGFAWTL